LNVFENVFPTTSKILELLPENCGHAEVGKLKKIAE